MELVICDEEDFLGFDLIKERVVNRPYILAVIPDEVTYVDLMAWREPWSLNREGRELKGRRRELVCRVSDGAEPRTGFAFGLHVEQRASRDVRKKMCHRIRRTMDLCATQSGRLQFKFLIT